MGFRQGACLIRRLQNMILFHSLYRASGIIKGGLLIPHPCIKTRYGLLRICRMDEVGAVPWAYREHYHRQRFLVCATAPANDPAFRKFRASARYTIIKPDLYDCDHGSDTARLSKVWLALWSKAKDSFLPGKVVTPLPSRNSTEARSYCAARLNGSARFKFQAISAAFI